MNLPDYMRDLSQDLLEQSRRIARDITHAVGAGEAREEVVERTLSAFLPEAFGVARGFIFSSDGQRSSQTDLIIYDKLWSRPFYGRLKADNLFAAVWVHALSLIDLERAPAELNLASA